MASEKDVIELLRAASLYPVPREVAEGFAARRGVDTAAPPPAPYEDRGFCLALADVYMWLAAAPAVAQGGQHYALNDKDKDALRAAARNIYKQHNDPRGGDSPYGYKGDTL